MKLPPIQYIHYILYSAKVCWYKTVPSVRVLVRKAMANLQVQHLACLVNLEFDWIKYCRFAKFAEVFHARVLHYMV